MIPTPNDGSRPSRLLLDRYATGELTGAARGELESRLDDDGRAHLAALEQARADLPPLDPAALRARARSVGPTDDVDIPTSASAANDTRAFRWIGVVIAMAAAVLVAIGIGRGGGDDGRLGPRFRSGEEIVVFEQRGRVLEPWAGEPLGQGDRIGLEVTTSGREGVVVVSVDGTGALTVFWPENGQTPEPLVGEGLVALPGTVVLDGAPGPEVFVTVYDRPVPEARAEVERVYRESGAAGLLRWAERTEGVGAVEVPRR